MQQYHSGCNNFPEKKKKRTTVRCRKLKRNKLGLGACKRGTLLGGGGETAATSKGAACSRSCSMNRLEEQPLKSLSQDFLSLLLNGQSFSDVSFAVEGRHVYAHKCVLAARSPFFRMIFCGDAHMLDGAPAVVGNTTQQQQPQPPRGAAVAAAATVAPQVIPVGIVGHDVFMLLLQFLYTGNLCFSPQNLSRACKEKSCWHTHCSSAVEFTLETLNAAHFFGVDQLSTLTQKHLAAMAEKASIEDVMHILVAAQKQAEPQLWNVCSKLVAKSGLPSDILQKHLPAEMVVEIESIRQKTGYGYNGSSISNSALMNQRTRRMQKALDSSDVELVNMMVMGEGLNLDKALALHYAVSNCSRKVVKTLLDLGAANVNLRGPDGRTPLHMVAEVGDPEMIAMLLDHQADPRIQTANGRTAIDIVQAVAADALAAGVLYNPSIKGDHHRLRLCLELLERAGAAIAVHAGGPLKLGENGRSSVSTILTEHARSSSPLLLLPEESNNFASMPRAVINPLTRGAQLGNNDFYSTISQGNGHGNDLERRETSDSISGFVQQSSLAWGGGLEEQQWQKTDSSSPNYSFTVEQNCRLEGRSSNTPPGPYSDLKDLTMLREVVLKDITNEAAENLKNATTTNFADEEVNSGWQLFFQER